jgi:hypothetical protein
MVMHETTGVYERVHLTQPTGQYYARHVTDCLRQRYGVDIGPILPDSNTKATSWKWLSVFKGTTGPPALTDSTALYTTCEGWNSLEQAKNWTILNGALGALQKQWNAKRNETSATGSIPTNQEYIQAAKYIIDRKLDVETYQTNGTRWLNLWDHDTLVRSVKVA